MVARPVAVPRSKNEADEGLSRQAGIPASPDDPERMVSADAGTLAPEQDKDDLPSLDYSDFVFSESSPDFQIEAEIDPIDAEAEEAAVLYANGQDEAVRAILENAVRVHHFGPGERLWLMLFDLYRLTGNKAAFEALEIDYAQAFEKSPPGWRDKSNKSSQKTTKSVAGSSLFLGELTGDNKSAFVAVHQSLEKNKILRLDLSKVSTIDAKGCGYLLSLLQQARKAKKEIELLGRDKLGVLVHDHVVPGKAEEKECWLLFLELCQLQGQREIFEDLAVDYAVTFEVSPPSWEEGRVAIPEPIAQTDAVGVGGDVAVDAYVLRGDIKSLRFGDLSAHAEMYETLSLDCSELTRMDFISAGALLNTVTTVRRAGKQVIFRHPNYLVAELLGVVGVKAVATIVYAKH